MICKSLKLLGKRIEKLNKFTGNLSFNGLLQGIPT